jgi:hypothetical protein
MTRGNKKFLSAIFTTMFVFLVDIYILGLSNSFATTSKGIVSQADLTNALLSDKSFVEYERWGNVVIESSTAFILLFVIIPVITFVLTLLLAFRGK